MLTVTGIVYMIAEFTRHGTKQLKMMLLQEVVHQVAEINTLILQAIWYIFN